MNKKYKLIIAGVIGIAILGTGSFLCIEILALIKQ